MHHFTTTKYLLSASLVTFVCNCATSKNPASETPKDASSLSAEFFPIGTRFKAKRDIVLQANTSETYLVTGDPLSGKAGSRVWIKHDENGKTRVLKTDTPVDLVKADENVADTLVLTLKTPGNFQCTVFGFTWDEKERIRPLTIREFEKLGFFAIEEIPAPVAIR